MFSRSPSSLSSFSKAKRDLTLSLKRSPLFSWRYEARDITQLSLVPRDLRTADPSLSIELDMGQFGLAGATVLLDGRSPFQVAPPNLAWERELHGFGWLRNLRAARTDRAISQSIDLTEEWLENFRRQKGVAYEPQVAARRLISWLSYSNFLLQDVDERRYLTMMRAIEDHMRHLSISGAHAPDGMPRLLSLIALVYAGLCISNQEKFAEAQSRLLCVELDRQILPDGGHISRDNSVLASILLDLLPLKQCFVTKDIKPPKPLIDAINRMLPMIHYMRLGDGLMSRFNGAGTTLPDTLSTAMAYDDVYNAPLKDAPYSKYYRLEAGNVVVLLDGGSPPSAELSEKAHAGGLSFELSSGTCPMIVNCGAAPPSFQTMALNARATVSHSTLTINNRSSARFLHDEKFKDGDHPSLLIGPDHIEARYEYKDGTSKIVGSHNGYLARFGLVHHRLLTLSQDGYTLEGEDWIEVPKGGKQAANELGWPFAVHFHIHPDVLTTRASDGKSLTLTLPDTQEWKFYAGGALIYLEESTFYADFAGPCQAVQAVIRGNCLGQTSIPWKITKTLSGPIQAPRELPAWLVENVVPIDGQAEEQVIDETPPEEEAEGSPVEPDEKKVLTSIDSVVDELTSEKEADSTEIVKEDDPVEIARLKALHQETERQQSKGKKDKKKVTAASAYPPHKPSEKRLVTEEKQALDDKSKTDKTPGLKQDQRADKSEPPVSVAKKKSALKKQPVEKQQAKKQPLEKKKEEKAKSDTLSKTKDESVSPPPIPTAASEKPLIDRLVDTAKLDGKALVPKNGTAKKNEGKKLSEKPSAKSTPWGEVGGEVEGQVGSEPSVIDDGRDKKTETKSDPKKETKSKNQPEVKSDIKSEEKPSVPVKSDAQIIDIKEDKPVTQPQPADKIPSGPPARLPGAKDKLVKQKKASRILKPRPRAEVEAEERTSSTDDEKKKDSLKGKDLKGHSKKDGPTAESSEEKSSKTPPPLPEKSASGRIEPQSPRDNKLQTTIVEPLVQTPKNDDGIEDNKKENLPPPLPIVKPDKKDDPS